MDSVIFSYVMIYFCAVAYGATTSFVYELYSENEINGNAILSFDTSSVQACVVRCDDTYGCLSVNFHKENKKCVLTDYYPADETKSGVPESGWKTFFRRHFGKVFYCPGKYNYRLIDLHANGVRVDTVTSITFLTKGSNGAHILLQNNRSEGIGNAVEIILGGHSNTRSAIKNGRLGIQVANHTGNVLNPGAYTWFWISWNGGCVQVGKARTVGTNILMQWCGLSHPIKRMSITYWVGSDGYFNFCVDLLKGATALQSSTLNALTADLAIDGITDQDAWNSQSCAHPDRPLSYWAVEFGTPGPVKEVEIYLRSDAYLWGNTNITVTVLDSRDDVINGGGTVCGKYFGPAIDKAPFRLAITCANTIYGKFRAFMLKIPLKTRVCSGAKTLADISDLEDEARKIHPVVSHAA